MNCEAGAAQLLPTAPVARVVPGACGQSFVGGDEAVPVDAALLTVVRSNLRPYRSVMQPLFHREAFLGSTLLLAENRFLFSAGFFYM